MRRLVLAASTLLIANVLLVAPAAAAAAQTITFTMPAAGTLDDSFALTATADSGLPVSYATSTPATCALVGATLSLDALGICTVTASQAGDATYDPAPDVTRSIEILLASDAPQTIDFGLPPTGVVGGSVELTATSSSGLEVTFAIATPATCSLTGTTVRLEILGTCGVIASQPGNDIWLPAPDVRADITIELSPVGPGVNLGRLALNGPVVASVIDPATGTTYVAGGFSEIGIRTGSVAFIDPPSIGDDHVADATPDVIGNQISVLADDGTSGFFVVGHVESIDGDGVRRWGVTRMTPDGEVDTTWALHDPCSLGALPRWSVGSWLIAPYEASKDGTGYSTMGLQLIDKATGTAHATGTGTSSCASSGRRWPSVAPWAPLVACKAWAVCTASPSGVALDETTQTLIVDMHLVSGQTTATARPARYLVGYDLVAGTRRWTRALQDPGHVQGSQVLAMSTIGGSVLIVGDLRFDAGTSTASTMALLDALTGTVLQRWDPDGEQSLADPSAIVTPATACTPAHDGLGGGLRFDFVPLDAAHAIGYGRTTAPGPVRDVPVCEYSVTGIGVDARLTSTQRGSLSARADRVGNGWLPGALLDDRYLVGGFDAFDLASGTQVDGWNPSPSEGIDLTVVAVGDAVVVGGPFTFLHGAAVDHVLALDAELEPIDGFDAEIDSTAGNSPWIRAVTIAGGSLIVAGIIGQAGQQGPVVALDLQTGARRWGEVTAQVADAWVLAPTPDGAGFYVGGAWLGDGSDNVLRYLPAGDGFVRDATWHPTFGALRGHGPAVTGLNMIDERLYVGGTFGSVDGLSRQALARFKADGSLDTWAPRFVDELAIPATATPELYARAFHEVGTTVVIAGSFQWILPTGVTPSASIVLAYSASTGARVKPVGTNAPWFPLGHDWGAYDIDRLGDTLYVAMGNSGVGAFDVATLAYLPNRSIRFVSPTEGLVYAIEIRQPGGRTTARQLQATSSAEAIVIGGNIDHWGDRSAGNVVEVGIDRNGPLVLKRAPAKASTGVRRDTRVTVTLSESASGTTTGVALVDTTTSKRVPASTTYDAKSRTVTIDPDALLAAGRLYKVKVLSSVKDAAGNAARPVEWTFRVSTDATRPQIAKRRPRSGETGVARTSNVVITFSEIVSVSPSRIRLRDGVTGSYVSAKVTISTSGLTATLDPSVTLRGSRRYTVVVKGVTDRAGNPIATTTWTFTTRR